MLLIIIAGGLFLFCLGICMTVCFLNHVYLTKKHNLLNHIEEVPLPNTDPTLNNQETFSQIINNSEADLI